MLPRWYRDGDIGSSPEFHSRTESAPHGLIQITPESIMNTGLMRGKAIINGVVRDRPEMQERPLSNLERIQRTIEQSVTEVGDRRDTAVYDANPEAILAEKDQLRRNQMINTFVNLRRDKANDKRFDRIFKLVDKIKRNTDIRPPSIEEFLGEEPNEGRTLGDIIRNLGENSGAILTALQDMPAGQTPEQVLEQAIEDYADVETVVDIDEFIGNEDENMSIDLDEGMLETSDDLRALNSIIDELRALREDIQQMGGVRGQQMEAFLNDVYSNITELTENDLIEMNQLIDAPIQNVAVEEQQFLDELTELIDEADMDVEANDISELIDVIQNIDAPVEDEEPIGPAGEIDPEGDAQMQAEIDELFDEGEQILEDIPDIDTLFVFVPEIQTRRPLFITLVEDGIEDKDSLWPVVDWNRAQNKLTFRFLPEDGDVEDVDMQIEYTTRRPNWRGYIVAETEDVLGQIPGLIRLPSERANLERIIKDPGEYFFEGNRFMTFN